MLYHRSLILCRHCHVHHVAVYATLYIIMYSKYMLCFVDAGVNTTCSLTLEIQTSYCMSRTWTDEPYLVELLCDSTHTQYRWTYMQWCNWCSTSPCAEFSPLLVAGSDDHGSCVTFVLVMVLGLSAPYLCLWVSPKCIQPALLAWVSFLSWQVYQHLPWTL